MKKIIILNTMLLSLMLGTSHSLEARWGGRYYGGGWGGWRGGPYYGGYWGGGPYYGGYYGRGWGGGFGLGFGVGLGFRRPYYYDYYYPGGWGYDRSYVVSGSSYIRYTNVFNNTGEIIYVQSDYEDRTIQPGDSLELKGRIVSIRAKSGYHISLSGYQSSIEVYFNKNNQLRIR